MPPVYKRRVDNNHKEIVEFIRKTFPFGRVFSLHEVGDDFPDVIFGMPGLNLLMEIKSEKGKLSKGQKEFHSTWPGPICVVWSKEDAAFEINKYSALLKITQ